jgi:hypothetical protein
MASDNRDYHKLFRSQRLLLQPPSLRAFPLLSASSRPTRLDTLRGVRNLLRFLRFASRPVTPPESVDRPSGERESGPPRPVFTAPETGLSPFNCSVSGQREGFAVLLDALRPVFGGGCRSQSLSSRSWDQRTSERKCTRPFPKTYLFVRESIQTVILRGGHAAPQASAIAGNPARSPSVCLPPTSSDLSVRFKR